MKDKYLNIRISDEDDRKIKFISSAKNLSPSEAVRVCIREGYDQIMKEKREKMTDVIYSETAVRGKMRDVFLWKSAEIHKMFATIFQMSDEKIGSFIDRLNGGETIEVEGLTTSSFRIATPQDIEDAQKTDVAIDEQFGPVNYDCSGNPERI